MEEGRNDYTFADIEHADTLGAVQLMSGEGKKVDVHSFNINCYMTDGLHRIGVEKNSFFTADSPDLLYGHDGADLVVGKHNADEDGIASDCIADLFSLDHAVFVNGEISDLKTMLFQIFAGMKYRMMLDRRGDDMLTLALILFGNALESHIVGFGTAACEDYLVILGIERGSDLMPCILNGLMSFLPEIMQA